MQIQGGWACIRGPRIEDVFRAYEATLAADNTMDFADILLRSVREMRNGTLKPLPCAWMLVDEGQDMDARAERMDLGARPKWHSHYARR